jgi:hypothetical protein
MWCAPVIDAKPLEITKRGRGRPRRVTADVLEVMKALDGKFTRAEITRRLGIHRNAFVQHLGRRFTTKRSVEMTP